jgi:hypothetical protein
VTTTVGRARRRRPRRRAGPLLGCALGLWLASSAAAQDDDLGSQPLKTPSAADLGVADPAVEAPPAPVRSRSSPSSTAPSPSSPPAARPSPLPAGVSVSAALTAALHDLDDADPKALERRLEAALALPGDASSPSVRPLQRLVRARLAILQGRFDDAELQLREAGAALDAAALEGQEARRLREAGRFLRAHIAEGRARPVLFGAGCGRALGIRRLARDEAADREAAVADVTARYRAVVEGRDRFWSRRAAFAAARLSEAMARRALGDDGAPSFRTVILPPPYSIDAIDPRALVEPTLGAWLASLRRTYAEILASVDARDPDDALVERVRQQAAALALLEVQGVGEAVKNPWRREFHPGLVRVARRAERIDATGRFAPVENAVAIEQMGAALAQQGITTVDGAFALAGLALVQPDTVPLEPILAALSSSEPRVVVAGMVAAERAVKGKKGAERAQALREPLLVATGKALDARPRERVPFGTLQDSLYEPVERGLLALLSLARADRSALDVIVVDDRLPVLERAWLAAEVADARLAQRYDAWGWDKDERVAALAVWGSVSSRGRRYAGYLLRPGDTGLVGCVSRALSN